MNDKTKDILVMAVPSVILGFAFGFSAALVLYLSLAAVRGWIKE